jgi:hypothetical protein
MIRLEETIRELRQNLKKKKITQAEIDGLTGEADAISQLESKISLLQADEKIKELTHFSETIARVREQDQKTHRI